MILVVAQHDDEHAVAVIKQLSALGCHTEVIDTGSFPQETTIIEHLGGPEPSFAFVTGNRHVSLDQCRAAWWRRPQPYRLHEGLSADAQTFAYGECHEALAGLWHSLPAHWINEPQLDSAAHHKPYQLTVAAQVGLHVPRTLITSDPDAARAFIAQQGTDRTVYKTFLASAQCWRETRIVRQEELGLLETLRYAPVIFQEYIEAEADIRVTMIGTTVFAAAIRARRGGYEVDYRMDMPGASFEPTELPEGLTRQLRAFMSRMGLHYGAIDLRRSATGQFTFFEVNPAGEWRFVEERTQQPITRTMATFLAGFDRTDHDARRAPRFTSTLVDA